MGIFKASGNQRNPIQKSKIAQQQSNDLKHRARSKLIGALVLAIVAIILLPLIFDNDKPIKGTNNTAPLEAPIKTNPKDPVQVVISPTTPSDEPSTDVKPIVKNQNNNGQSIAQGTISNEPVEEESAIEPSKPAEEPKPVVTNKEPKQDKKIIHVQMMALKLELYYRANNLLWILLKMKLKRHQTAMLQIHLVENFLFKWLL